MIDIRKLESLVRLMVENDLSELDLKDQEETVTIKRGTSGVPMVAAPPAHYARPAGTPAPEGDPGSTSRPASDAGLVAIESPMVGTFYSAANPESPAFVQVGAQVSSGTVVCLIEAMKVFNEIKSEISGTVERVLVNSNEPVEFGQKLFMVRPA